MSELMQFITEITPRYHAPLHLAPLVTALERIIAGEQLFVTVAVPPRHEKTDTLGAAIAYGLRVRPTIRFGYVSYSQTLSEAKSRRFRAMAERARVKLDSKAAQLANWRTRVPRGEEPGGSLHTSTGGPFTGEGVDVLIVDDPVKDRMSAESSLIRDRIHEWFTNTALPRLEPGGSVIVCMHRWHPDDLIGRLLAEGGWEEISLPAIDANGEPLLAERFSLAQLVQIRERVGEYTWQSLYQQNPQARGGAVFGGGVRFYAELPSQLTFAIGLDLGYSTKSSADPSVACVLARDATSGKTYVVEVVRVREEAPSFLARIRALRDRYHGAPLVMYAGGTEKGTIDTFRSMGVDIAARPAIADKFTRAQPVAAAWTAGKVLVPGRVEGSGVDAPRWVNDFVAEVTGFTGHDRHDDQVDALASAYDELQAGGLDLTLATATRHGVEPYSSPLGPAILIVAGTIRESAAIVVQRQELISPEQSHLWTEAGAPVVDEHNEHVPNPKWHAPRQVLRVVAAERLSRSIHQSAMPIAKLVRRHDVRRVLATQEPTKLWKEALRGFVTVDDHSIFAPAQIEEARIYVEGLIRDEKIAIDAPEVSGELAALDVNASAFVACVIHAGRLDLAGELASRTKHVIYDNEEDQRAADGEEDGEVFGTFGEHEHEHVSEADLYRVHFR